MPQLCRNCASLLCQSVRNCAKLGGDELRHLSGCESIRWRWLLMRQASEWKGFMVAIPALFLVGAIGVYAEDYRSEVFQLTGILTNRFVLFVVGYYWLQDRKKYADSVRSEAVTKGLLVPVGLPHSPEFGRFRGSILFLMSVLSLLVGIIFIFVDWVPWGVLLLMQVVIPVYGFFEGVLYRGRIARRRVLHRWTFLQLVGDEQFQ